MAHQPETSTRTQEKTYTCFVHTFLPGEGILLCRELDGHGPCCFTINHDAPWLGSSPHGSAGLTWDEPVIKNNQTIKHDSFDLAIATEGSGDRLTCRDPLMWRSSIMLKYWFPFMCSTQTDKHTHLAYSQYCPHTEEGLKQEGTSKYDSNVPGTLRWVLRRCW